MWKVTLSSYCGSLQIKGSFRQHDDGEGNETGKKAIGFMRKATTLHMQHSFLYISLSSLPTVRWNSLKRSFMEDVNTRLQISLPLRLNLVAVPKNPIPGKFTHILLHRKSMLWPIDSCQNRISTDQYDMLCHGLRCLERSRGFSKFTADQLLVFNWSQAQVPCFSKRKSSTSRFLGFSSFIQDRFLCSGYKSHYYFLM